MAPRGQRRSSRAGCPWGWETHLSGDLLQRLDDGFLKPSKLPAERRAQLNARFEALAQQAPAPPSATPVTGRHSSWSSALACPPTPLPCPAARW